MGGRGRYRRERRHVKVSGHDRVEALPFAAQPRLHNPIGAPTSRLARACFAGSWQADNYADRGADIEMLLRPVLEAGLLDIFDRMAAPDARGARFPAPYDRAVLGDRSYSALLDEYRRYACFLNVNSVKTSPTMCSRRVFELLACRTPVVSTPSRAIDELLGDVVVTVDSPADALAAVERLTSDPEHRDRVGHLGYRTVLSRHTYGHRVDGILDRVGIASPAAPPRVTVLAPTNRPEYLDRLLDNFSDSATSQQSCSCSPTRTASIAPRSIADSPPWPARGRSISPRE
jgi:glycosyltransferase involved in cell wall biosynthesis